MKLLIASLLAISPTIVFADPIMNHFHKPADEKRSVIVLTEQQYLPWLEAKNSEAPSFLNLATEGYLTSEPAPKILIKHII